MNGLVIGVTIMDPLALTRFKMGQEMGKIIADKVMEHTRSLSKCDACPFRLSNQVCPDNYELALMAMVEVLETEKAGLISLLMRDNSQVGLQLVDDSDTITVVPIEG